MKISMIKGYYFITDSDLSKNGNMTDVKDSLDAGVSIVQYRSKMLEAEEADFLKKVCEGRALFIVNNMVEIALSVDADGVHLGQGDMPYEKARKILGKDKIIGITVRNLKQAMTAEKKGASYLSVGPIFLTTTKKDAGGPCGIELIKEIKKSCKIPLVAIGGITLENAQSVIDAGADSICAISAVVTKDDVKNEILKFQRLFTR